jgi:uncharacterized protein
MMDMLQTPMSLSEQTELTPLEPGYARAIRIVLMLNCLPLLIGAVALDIFVVREWTFGVPVLSLLFLLLSIWLIVAVPGRRLKSWGYSVGADQLRVVHGVVFHTDTIVPFVRVQHIDVGRGPIERMVGTATLTVHTAGNHNSTVSLPGLHPDMATALRDRIRANIQTDFG